MKKQLRPVLEAAHCKLWTYLETAIWSNQAHDWGNYARPKGRERSPRNLGVLAARGAAGSRPWQQLARLWVAGSPGLLVAGCNTSCSSCFPSPPPQSTSQLIAFPVGPGANVCLPSDGLLTNPSCLVVYLRQVT